MACGDKYSDLLVTSTGFTPEDPCWVDTPFCLVGEYDRWKIVADNVAGEVKRRIGILGGTSGGDRTAPPPPGKLPKALNTRIADYRTNYGKLSSGGWVNLLVPDFVQIEEAISNAREGTCVMELLDEQITKDGGEIPATTAATPRPGGPGVGTKILVGVGALAAVGAVGVIAWWAITKPSDESEAA